MDPRLEHISVRKALSAIADIAMPRVCVVCGSPLIPQECNICTECLADLPRTRFSQTLHNPMADKFNALVDDTSYCYAAALYYYSEEAGYRKISQSLKYNRNFSVGRQFGRMLGEELVASSAFTDVDAVVPVPLHWTRQWKRGYNQAEVIGKEVAAIFGCTVAYDMLRRTHRTRTQTEVSVEDKLRNVTGAFSASFYGNFKHILLVDDVFTSGSTLAACHAALRSVCDPSVRISIATLGYVSANA